MTPSPSLGLINLLQRLPEVKETRKFTGLLKGMMKDEWPKTQLTG